MDNNRREITPESIYLSRRSFLVGTAALAAGTTVLAACTGPAGTTTPGFCDGATAMANTDELGRPITPCQRITEYNNYYEFSYSKSGIGNLGKDFPTSPWTVAVGGLVANPKSYTMDELLQHFPQEERIYRMRCVEAWSMVIPWLGFPLASLLNEAAPTPDAKFVRFQAVNDPEHMPGQQAKLLNFPYIEGLRLDEAMHPLTIMATGLYGKPLPVQDGAPIRLVVPWKYGFKSIKAVIKIDLVTEMPVSSWMEQSPDEYGFYANVNPEVSHPRWSQAQEQYIGQSGFHPTLLFNGYDTVASLYANMDLKTNF